MSVLVLWLMLMMPSVVLPTETRAPVAVRVNTSVANAPATVMVTATVEPDERNRTLILTASSNAYLRRSSIQLEGDDEARVHQMWLRGLPRGDYEVTADVLGAEERHISARTIFIVVDAR